MITPPISSREQTNASNNNNNMFPPSILTSKEDLMTPTTATPTTATDSPFSSSSHLLHTPSSTTSSSTTTTSSSFLLQPAAKISSIAYTPKAEWEKQAFKYSCPLCFLYFTGIFKSQCCQNYVCEDCLIGLIVAKTHNQISDSSVKALRDILRNNLSFTATGANGSHPSCKFQGITCPFCNCENVCIERTRVNEKIRNYSDSPHVVAAKLKALKFTEPNAQSDYSPIKIGDDFERMREKMLAATAAAPTTTTATTKQVEAPVNTNQKRPPRANSAPTTRPGTAAAMNRDETAAAATTTASTMAETMNLGTVAEGVRGLIISSADLDTSYVPANIRYREGQEESEEDSHEALLSVARVHSEDQTPRSPGEEEEEDLVISPPRAPNPPRVNNNNNNSESNQQQQAQQQNPIAERRKPNRPRSAPTIVFNSPSSINTDEDARMNSQTAIASVATAASSGYLVAAANNENQSLNPIPTSKSKEKTIRTKSSCCTII